MNVAPSAPKQTPVPSMELGSGSPLQRLNIFKTIGNAIGLETYQVPDRTRDCIKALAPNLREKFGKVFGTNRAEAPSAA
ncbi:hypothetical protein KKA95_03985 [Patescibacteria group bacterium]|nr:hypothetical protein [Patescibacteria group bacterium]MBU1934650.1 hypothetical protein [Patescibacteria group bacterium]